LNKPTSYSSITIMSPKSYILLGAVTAIAVLHAVSETDPQKARITISADKAGVIIPSDFLGFSFEKKILSRECFQPSNTPLINLFRNLGRGIIRVGAAEGDCTEWSRSETSPLASMKSNRFSLKISTIGPLSVDNLFGFAKECGWRVIYGLNLGSNKPEMAADEAAYAMQMGGPMVLALEVGNEPNLFHHNNKKLQTDAKDLGLNDLRPNGYTYAQFRDETERYYQTILARLPHAPMTGPATTKTCPWVPDFIRDFKDRIVLVTSHGYPLSAKEENLQSPRFPSVENLLSVNIEDDWLPKLKAATSANLPWRLDEYNSASGGGKRGLSDSFASALWNTDFMFKVAEHGGAGINIHGGFSPGNYSPIYFLDNSYHASPIYYSMLLFHQAGLGRLLSVECQTSANLAVHAVLGDDHKLRVVLINKDLKSPVEASVITSFASTKAEVIRLTAPSVTSTEGVSLAGSSVLNDGSWKAQPGEPIQGVNGKFEVFLPAVSAALLTIDNGG